MEKTSRRSKGSKLIKTNSIPESWYKFLFSSNLLSKGKRKNKYCKSKISNKPVSVKYNEFGVDEYLLFYC